MSVIEYVVFRFTRTCFFSGRRRHTRCTLVTGVQTCALPIYVIVIQERDLVAGISGNLRPRFAATAARIAINSHGRLLGGGSGSTTSAPALRTCRSPFSARLGAANQRKRPQRQAAINEFAPRSGPHARADSHTKTPNLKRHVVNAAVHKGAAHPPLNGDSESHHSQERPICPPGPLRSSPSCGRQVEQE